MESVQIFKPHPSVYSLAELSLMLPSSAILFVSSNSWDATGAGHYGYPTCWVNRSGNTFEELGQQPTYVVDGIDKIAAILKR